MKIFDLKIFKGKIMDPEEDSDKSSQSTEPEEDPEDISTVDDCIKYFEGNLFIFKRDFIVKIINILFEDKNVLIDVLFDQCYVNDRIYAVDYFVYKCIDYNNNNNFDFLKKVLNISSRKIPEKNLYKSYQDNNIDNFKEFLDITIINKAPEYTLHAIGISGTLIYAMIQACDNLQKLDMIKLYIEKYNFLECLYHGTETSMDYVSYAYSIGRIDLVKFFIEKNLFKLNTEYFIMNKSTTFNLFNFVFFNKIEIIDDLVEDIIKNSDYFFNKEGYISDREFYINSYLYNCKNFYRILLNIENNIDLYLNIFRKIDKFEKEKYGLKHEKFLDREILKTTAMYLKTYIGIDSISLKILKYMKDELEFDLLAKDKNHKTIFQEYSFSPNLRLELGIIPEETKYFLMRCNISCCVCLDDKKELYHGYNPCGHIGVCFDCSEILKDTCPICRSDIETKTLFKAN